MTRHDLLTFNGVTQPIAEWALDYGIPAGLILDRVRRGMPVVKAITKPMLVKPGQKLDDETWGVVDNFAKRRGTGGGSVARDRAEIEFSANPESSPS